MQLTFLYLKLTQAHKCHYLYPVTDSKYKMLKNHKTKRGYGEGKKKLFCH